MGCPISCSKDTVRVHPRKFENEVSQCTQITRGDLEEGLGRRGLQSNPRQHPNIESLEMIWKIIASRTGADSSDKPKRAGNTVHLYVASIFKDFVQEREFLASHVFPELAYWCSNHQLNFLPVDLRYDLTHSADTVQFTATCLQEIDRLVEDGVPVCFLAFLSEQVGYIPSSEMAPSLGCTDWIDGISLLEMEIVKGAFFASNPNALFLCRDPSSLAQLPPDIASKYQPANSSEAARMDFLKSKLLSKYPEQVYSYTTNTSYSAVTGDVKFGGFESFVSKVVLDFFQLRIKSEFMVSPTPVLNPLECIEYHQQKDLTSRTKAPLVGKQQLVDKIKHYIEDPFNNAPLLILGDLGSGKTTVLAHMAAHYKDKYSTARKEQQLLQIQFDAQQEQARHDNAMRMERTDKRRFSVIGNLLSQKSSETWYNGELTNRGTSSFSHKRLRRISEHSRPRRMVHDDSCINHETPLEEHGEEYFDLNYPSAKITSRTDSEWQVFYHSVGSHPLSRELRYILQRLWRVEGLGEPRMTDMPSDCNALANKIREMLSTCGQKRFLLFLDSIDKIRGEFSSNVLKWIPSKLPSNVRIVTSLYSGSEVRKVLTSREPKCLELTNGSPSLAQSKVLLRSGLEHAGIMENPDLMEVLLNKHGIGNPLYITELCGELSRLDTTHTSSGWVVEKAKVLPNDLPGLYNHVLSAVEESLGRAGIAVLCLLYCSRCGLTEVELLEMLGTLEESNEQGNQIEDPQWSGLIGDESGLMGSQRFGASDISSWSASDVERTSLCESNASGNVIKSRKPSVELHLPLHGPPLPGSAARLSPWINHRKISSCSSGSAPEHTHTHPHSPLLLPSTPDFSRFGATPPGSLRRRHSRPSPSLTPVSSRLSPIFGHRNPTIDLHIDKEQLPPAEIEEASTDSRQKSSKSSHTDNPSPVKLTKKMSALRWATVYRTLKPFITNIGGPAETKWVLSNQSFSKAVYKKYFKNPPISSFPFSFSSFCGAYNDTIHHYFRKKKSGDPSTRLHASPGDTDMLSADLLLKRSLWWHSRLVWYFQSYCTDPRRRGEELPYHLVQLQNTNKLTKCLSSVEIFRSLSLPQKSMDLQYYWSCAGGGSACVTACGQMLASLEISGASPQELVKTMKQVALVYQSLGVDDSARQLLLDAVDVAESHLGGRTELSAELMFQLVRLLSRGLTTQMDISDPQTLMEPEYRLLKTGGKTAEVLRSLDTSLSRDRLASLLLILSRHLNHYASQGGSAELTSRHAMEQACEAAHEAAALFLKLYKPAKSIEALLDLAKSNTGDPQQQLKAVKSAEKICLSVFGSVNSTMADVLSSAVEILAYYPESGPDLQAEYSRRLHELNAILRGREDT